MSKRQVQNKIVYNVMEKFDSPFLNELCYTLIISIFSFLIFIHFTNQITSKQSLAQKLNLIFQYKLLNNVLCLNKKLFQLGIISQPKCPFCELYDETPHHIFYECTYVQNLNRLCLYLIEKVALPVLNPQSAIFGFTDVSDHNFLLVNHLRLIFKYNIYNSRVNNRLSLQSLKCFFSQIK